MVISKSQEHGIVWWLLLLYTESRVESSNFWYSSAGTPTIKIPPRRVDACGKSVVKGFETTWDGKYNAGHHVTSPEHPETTWIFSSNNMPVKDYIAIFYSYFLDQSRFIRVDFLHCLGQSWRTFWSVESRSRSTISLIKLPEMLKRPISSLGNIQPQTTKQEIYIS